MAMRSDRQPDDQDAVVAGGTPAGAAAEDRIFFVAAPEPPHSAVSLDDATDSAPQPGRADAPRRRQIPTIPHPRGRGVLPSPAARPAPPILSGGRRAEPDAEPDRYFGSGPPVGPGAIEPGPADGARRPRRHWVLGAAVATVALLAAGVLWTARDRGAGDSRQSALPLPASGTVAETGSPVPPSAEVTTSVPVAPQGGSTKAGTSKPAPQALANPAGVDLALNRPVRASSSEGPAWYPAYAVDGKQETRWSSGFSDPQWISIDLGAQRQLSVIRLSWEHAYATAYRVQVSPDGRTWKAVFSTTHGQGGEVTISTGDVAGRHVRVYGTRRSSQYGYSLLEIDVR
jgi:hypothetical protein